MTNRNLGRWQILLSSIAFALTTLSVHWAYSQGFNPYNLHLGVSLLAAAALLASPRARGWTASLREPLVWLYGLAGGGSGLLFGVALLHVQPGLATLLFYTYPVAVTLGAWPLFGRRPRPRDWQALALTVGGAALTAGPLRGGATWLGVTLVLIAMVTFAVYVLLGERVLQRWSPPAVTGVMRIMQALIVIAVAPVAATRLPAGPPLLTVSLLLVATVAALYGFLLLTEGLARVNATVAALLTIAELPLAMVLSRLLFGEQFTGLQGAGAFLIIAGLVWAETGAAVTTA